MKTSQQHNSDIIDQFSKQAIPFTQLPGHLDSIQMLIEMSQVTEKDTVLDIACGPGLVVCEFAKHAQHVAGIDLTDKMIEQAKLRQRELKINNVSWQVGTVLPLPYDDDSFTAVITRYSFHHFLNPKAALSEMIRVCKPNGTILIADASLPEDKVDSYNHMEKLRDPSHTKALSDVSWNELLSSSGLQNLKKGSYKVEMELEKQLKASFPNPGDDEKIREIFKRDTEINSLGMDAHWVGDEIHFSYPISIYTGTKPAEQ